MKILSAAEMREVDRRTIEEIGVPATALMENAGAAVAATVADGLTDGGRVAIVCGRGNNGGDGLVAARHLSNRGAAVTVFLLGRVDALKNTLVLDQAQAARRFGIQLVEMADEPALAGVSFAGFATVVDAIFGTGFRPPATGLEAAAIERITAAREAGANVVAVDLPSGLDADSGRLEGPATVADLSVTFAAPKPVHFLMPAAARCGQLRVVDISVPRRLIDSPGHRLELVEADQVRALLRRRARDAHKGTFGHLLLVAGTVGKTGAAILAARAALRAGAGLVTVATPSDCLPLVASGAPEVMTEPLPTDGDFAATRVVELLASRDALAIGPGLGTGVAAQAIVHAALARAATASASVATVADADALNVLAADGTTLTPADRPLVLTPHPGEAARLLGQKPGEVNADRLGSARRLAATHGATTLLKGHRSVTALADGRAYINDTGNPGLATAGTGDVLTGIIGALLAQGLAGDAATIAGAYLHGLAGDIAAATRGEASLIASDVIDALPEAFRSVAEPA